jgi:hypothetical protein
MRTSTSQLRFRNTIQILSFATILLTVSAACTPLGAPTLGQSANQAGLSTQAAAPRVTTTTTIKPRTTTTIRPTTTTTTKPRTTTTIRPTTTTTTKPRTTTTIRPTTTTTTIKPRTTGPVSLSASFHDAQTTATLGGCKVFPADHYMNATNVNSLPVRAESTAWLNSIGGASTNLVAPSSTIWQGSRPGTPMNIVDSRVTGFKPVTFGHDWSAKSYLGPYALPVSPVLQGAPNVSGAWDKRLMVVDSAECMAYELIQYTQVWNGNSFNRSALAGSRYSLNSNEMPLGTTNAPNTPMIGQYVLNSEVRSGTIPHVMAFCSQNTRISTTSMWPARKSDGFNTAADAMPMGTWVRLASSVNPSSFSGGTRVIVEALQTRGAILTDSCAHQFSLLAENSPDWNNADMAQLTRLTPADFEVVDSAAMKLSDTSYAVR